MVSRPFSTILSVLLLTLGVGMIALLLNVNNHIQEQIQNNVRGIDMVVGAKGSPMQLILSAVYHIDAPTGNIDLDEAERLQKNPWVSYGIPLSYGDSYQGYRIVGTDHQYPELYNAKIAEGRLWKKTLEVVVGSKVAKKLNLSLGDTFSGTHGLNTEGDTHEEHSYLVVGILEYSNSVIDQLIITSTESVWEVHHHEDHEELAEEEDHKHDGEDKNHEHEEDHESEQQHEHEEHREVTALLVKVRNPIGMIQLPRMINEDTNMQAAVPVYEINRLFGLMGVGLDTLSTIALVIMIVSGLSVFISLYNALKDRQYEMALMRSYGATRWQLVWLVLQEGLLITFSGFISGIILSRIGLWLLSDLMETNYHYTLSEWSFRSDEAWLLVIALFIGVMASLIPAIRVFKLNISKTLADA